MLKAKGTTPKALQIKGSNNGVGESSFRVLYYGAASAGSVPFMWESQPGTPKHALTESSPPPLTPPPCYNRCTQKYNSSMQLIKQSSPKRSSSLRTLFLGSSRKIHVPAPASFLSSSVSSSSSSYSSQSTPVSKTEFRRTMSAVKFGLEDDCGGGGGSPTSTLCFGRGFMKVYRIMKVKKATGSFLGHGKA